MLPMLWGDAETRQCRGKRLRWWLTGREQELGRRRPVLPRRAYQVDHAPRDRRRRIDKATGQGASRSKRPSSNG